MIKQEIALAVEFEFLVTIVVVVFIRRHKKHAMFDLRLVNNVKVQEYLLVVLPVLLWGLVSGLVDVHLRRARIAPVNAIYRKLQVLDPAANNADLREILTKVLKVYLLIEDNDLEELAKLT